MPAVFFLFCAVSLASRAWTVSLSGSTPGKRELYGVWVYSSCGRQVRPRRNVRLGVKMHRDSEDGEERCVSFEGVV